jgi:hypothetical protein
MSQLQKRSLPIVAVAAFAASMVLMAAPASAKTTTFHFFEKNLTSTFVGPTGQPVSPSANTAPVPGDRFNETSNDFVGNHKHHAKTSTASDHLECTFIDAMGNATCSGQIAIGGSLLLAIDATVNVGQNGVPAVPINGGTGKFKHAHGTVKSTSVGNSGNSDLTVMVIT